jgi:transcriptional regulator of NAD metabolism
MTMLISEELVDSIQWNEASHAKFLRDTAQVIADNIATIRSNPPPTPEIPKIYAELGKPCDEVVMAGRGTATFKEMFENFD